MVTLYYSQADFDAFNLVSANKMPTNATDAAGKARFRIFKISGTSSGTGLPNSYTGTSTTIDPDDNNIVWNATLNRWEISFNVNGFSGFFAQAAPTALSVELISFTGQAQDKQNLLQWQTASEKKNKHFDIERNTDGTTFHSIGQVKGNNKPSSYQFVDNQPFATTYYRLRQIDNDGKEALSKVISIATKSDGKGLKVYPNPVSSLLNVVYTEGSSFQILNLLGQQVLTGKTGQRLDVSTLPQGTYILKVGAEQAKFVKQ